MLKYLALSLVLVSNFAFAKDKKEVKYNTHFENPIVDDRIAFTSCAVEGALYGILTNNIGDVLCIGKLLGNNERTIYAFKGAKNTKVLYFEETESKMVSAVGEQAGGIRVYKVKLKTLNPKLEAQKNTKRTTLTITETWEYSDGNTIVKGTLPRARANFEANQYFLGEDLDRELREFASELND